MIDIITIDKLDLPQEKKDILIRLVNKKKTREYNEFWISKSEYIEFPQFEKDDISGSSELFRKNLIGANAIITNVMLFKNGLMLRQGSDYSYKIEADVPFEPPFSIRIKLSSLVEKDDLFGCYIFFNSLESTSTEYEDEVVKIFLDK